MINVARGFAVERHGNQKYGSKPYITHLEDVAKIVVDIDCNDETINAAYLHDILEDTKTTRQELQSLFGEEVAKIVYLVSGEGSNRKERTQSIYKKIRNAGMIGDWAASIKIADRIANVRSSANNNPALFNMYLGESNDFMSNLYGLGDVRLWAKLHDAYMQGLKNQIDVWHDAWYQQRDATGRAAWNTSGRFSVGKHQLREAVSIVINKLAIIPLTPDSKLAKQELIDWLQKHEPPTLKETH